LLDLGEIGRGGFGSVNKMIFKKTEKQMAVKRIRCSNVVDEKEQKRIMVCSKKY
jgi:mitogen-activated protein kinase kinase 4